jgi:hypothetical protein
VGIAHPTVITNEYLDLANFNKSLEFCRIYVVGNAHPTVILLILNSQFSILNSQFSSAFKRISTRSWISPLGNLAQFHLDILAEQHIGKIGTIDNRAIKIGHRSKCTD